MNIAAIAAGAIGGAVVALLIVGVVLCRRSRRRAKDRASLSVNEPRVDSGEEVQVESKFDTYAREPDATSNLLRDAPHPPSVPRQYDTSTHVSTGAVAAQSNQYSYASSRSFQKLVGTRSSTDETAYAESQPLWAAASDRSHDTKQFSPMHSPIPSGQSSSRRPLPHRPTSFDARDNSYFLNTDADGGRDVDSDYVQELPPSYNSLP